MAGVPGFEPGECQSQILVPFRAWLHPKIYLTPLDPQIGSKEMSENIGVINYMVGVLGNAPNGSLDKGFTGPPVSLTDYTPICLF